MSNLFDYHFRWIEIQRKEGYAIIHSEIADSYRKISVVSLSFMTLFLIFGLVFSFLESIYCLSFIVLQSGSWIIFMLAIIKMHTEIGKSTDIYIQLGREIERLGDDLRKEYQ